MIERHLMNWLPKAREKMTPLPPLNFQLLLDLLLAFIAGRALPKNAPSAGSSSGAS
jgi:hypothetical protein